MKYKVNELRIDYIINRLEYDKYFRNYKLKAIANTVGFHSTDAFSKAFYKKEKVKFSEYLRKVRDTKPM